MMKIRIISLTAFVLSVTSVVALAGPTYLPPVGGWTYIYAGDSATAGTGTGYDALDGTWSHDNGMD